MEKVDIKKVNQLIIKISKFDKAAVGEIYNMIGGRLLSIALSVVRNRSLAEEVVSDSLVKVVNNASKFTVLSNGYAWICKIVKNTALNTLEKERFKNKIPIDEIFNNPDTINYHEKLEDTLLIEESLKILDDREMQIIRLKFWEDMTMREIAKEMKLSLSFTHELLTKTISKIKKYINLQ